MKYEKPEIAVLGSATNVIQASKTADPLIESVHDEATMSYDPEE